MPEAIRKGVHFFLGSVNHSKSIFEQFCWILGAELGGKIDQKSLKNRIEQKDAKNKAVWDASWAVFGLSKGPRRTPTQLGATRRAENPLPGGRQGRRTSRKNT